MKKKKIAIIGAGPAGLSGAYILVKAGHDVVIFEKDENYVGGISRTESYKGYKFDIGGHRFFSKSKEIEDLWTEILGDDFLECPRNSSIYYKKKFYSYPLVALEALIKLGVVESLRCLISYLRIKIFPIRNPLSFEEWVTNQFGKRLYNIFFKTYTEKVWGVSCDKISADWAIQRIKGLSLSTAIKNALAANKETKESVSSVKTLINSFRYPKFGPGMMWESCAEKIKSMGGKLLVGQPVSEVYFNNNKKWIITTDGNKKYGEFDYVLSSAPIRELIPSIKPCLPQPVIKASEKLSYRDFLIVILILKDTNRFTDNWIYIHDNEVKVARIQNFKAWSNYMVPDESMTCYGLEYFCFEGDGLWKSDDAALIQLGKNEAEKIGICKIEDVIDGYVVRQQKAYPVYDKTYKENIAVIKNALKEYDGLYLVGRNGMHKYNNQDHSMMTAMLAAKNIIAGKVMYDVWNVNEDAEYIEEGERLEKNTGRLIPQEI